MRRRNKARGSVLIPQAEPFGHGLPAAYACVRSLGKRGIHTIVASERKVPESVSRYSGETVTVPSPRDDLVAYKDALLGIAARPDVQTVVPMHEEGIYVLSKYEEEFERYVTLEVPPIDILRNVHDRLRLAGIAEEAGVPVPKTRLLNDVNNWRSELIVKSRFNLLVDEYLDSLSSGESRVVKSVKHLQPGEEPDVDALCDEMGHVPIVQEFVPIADEYMFAALYDHGEAVATYQHRQIRGTSYVGGGGVYRESVYIPEFEEIARRLLDHLDWHGLACIEYMQDAKTGEFVLTEINPRTWQSLLSTVRAGADFPYYYWLLATDRKDRIVPKYEIGIGSHWLWGELEHLVSVLRKDSPLIERPNFPAILCEILSSCYEQPRFDYLRLDDPAPFLYDVVRRFRT